MEKSVFPKKFASSLEEHNKFMINELKEIHNKSVLELGTGSGNLSQLFPNDNEYVGVDISEGLLKIAYKKFRNADFKNFELFLCRAEDLPFQDKYFDVCLCNLSLNFFSDIEKVVKEINRTLKDGGFFICSVPVPERNKKKSIIRGTLYSENELKTILENNGFNYSSYNFVNGALLYFKAIKKL